MAQPILTQRAQWPDRTAEVQSTIAMEQAHQGGPTAEADRGQEPRGPK